MSLFLFVLMSFSISPYIRYSLGIGSYALCCRMYSSVAYAMFYLLSKQKGIQHGRFN
nr:MAG TPA: hypothetical protein [Caudoviricetes sp.]